MINHLFIPVLMDVHLLKPQHSTALPEKVFIFQIVMLRHQVVPHREVPLLPGVSLGKMSNPDNMLHHG
jgi:hypothetical protein